jgi:hypothetical protein
MRRGAKGLKLPNPNVWCLCEKGGTGHLSILARCCGKIEQVWDDIEAIYTRDDYREMEDQERTTDRTL